MVIVTECTPKSRVTGCIQQISEHIPPQLEHVNSIVSETSNVAPSILVCSFVLTIDVYYYLSILQMLV